MLDESDDEAETEAMQPRSDPQPSKQNGKQATGPVQQPSKASNGYGFIDDDEEMADTDVASDQTGDCRPYLFVPAHLTSQ